MPDATIPSGLSCRVRLCESAGTLRAIAILLNLEPARGVSFGEGSNSVA